MVAALTEADVSGNRAAVLWAAGAAALDRALENPGRVRSSAFELLTADALITYACEAALETDDPEGAIESLVGQGMSR